MVHYCLFSRPHCRLNLRSKQPLLSPRTRLILFAVAAYSCSVIPQADAAQLFVSPTGSDAANGSLATPFQTINKAVSLAQPGDSVELRAGTYREQVNALRSGAAGSPITIENYNGEQAVVSALDVVPGPWSAQGHGIYATTVTGSRPVSFWNTLTATSNGSNITEAAGFLRFIVANEAAAQTLQVRSQVASSAWDFFSSAVTWKVRGLSAASTGTTPMPLANMNAYFSVMTGTSNGFGSDDAATVYYRGDGRLQLYLKKNTLNTWGTVVQTVTDATITGYDLTLGPASGGNVAYTFTVKRSGGADVVTTGSWAITQAEWSDGGTGNRSFLGLLAQENMSTTDPAQKFTISADSYTITKGATVVFRDEFDDGDFATATEFPSSLTALSTGTDQVFVDGVMQHEAQFPNWTASNTLLAPAWANVSVNGDYTITSTSFTGLPDLSGARFLGVADPAWGAQYGVVTSNTGNTLTVDASTTNAYWFPNKYNYTPPSPGLGCVYGKLNLLDADGEWFLDRSAARLSLRITGGADPTGRVVELKRRNWCVNVNGYDYITVRGVKTVGGAIQLNGTGNIFENCDASFMSHFLDANGGGQPLGGVTLDGAGNTVRGCTIHETAGSGILAKGTRHLITRNEVNTTSYTPLYGGQAPYGGVWLSGTNHLVSFNLLHDSGRDVLNPGGAGHTIVFNDLYGNGWLTKDGGVFYIGAQDAMDASGYKTRIAYNYVHDTRPNPVGPEFRTYHNGIYIDGPNKNFKIDHNVCWNFLHNGVYDQGITLNFPNTGAEVYQNTLFNCASYEKTYTSWTSDVDYSYIAQNNLVIATTANPATTLTNTATRDFRLIAGNAAIDPAATSSTISSSQTNAQGFVFNYTEVIGSGIALPGINAWVPDGKPDNGAYEYNGPNWQPGLNGWEGWKMDPPLAVGVRTAIVQGGRISMDTTTSTTFRLYYGTTDGGTNPAAWSTFIDLGPVAPGDVMSFFSNALLGLTPSTTYYARYYSSNANGVEWSTGQSFTTAASLTWDAGGGATTNISTNTNWTADLNPDLTSGGEIANFGSAGSTVTINTNVSLLGIVLNRDANFTIANGAGSLTLGASGINVTLPSTTARTHVISESNVILAADQTWSINNNTGTAQLNVTSSIGGAFGFTKTGTGNLLLGGNSTFDGAVNVNVGPVVISGGNALGSAVGATTIAATGSTTTGGQVSLSGNITVPENFIITGTTETSGFAFPLNNSSGTNTISGSITLVGNSGVRFGASAGMLNLNGPILRNGTDNGSLLLNANASSVLNVNAPVDLNGGSLFFIGAGTTVLAAQSADIGSTTIYFGSPATNGTTVKLGINDALPTNKNLTFGTTGTSNGADRGTLDLAGFNQTVNGLIGSVGTGATPSAASTRRITNSASGTLSTITVGNGNASSTFNGLIENGAGQVALTKIGSGTLTLPTANTFTGDTTVSGGTLSLGTASLAATSAVNLSTGTVLNLNFTGTNNITTLRINGLAQAPGTWGSLSSSATNKTALITGNGLLNITGTQPPYDAWAIAIGLDNSTFAKDATLNADPDRDGVSNLMEYATKMNGGISDTIPVALVKNSGGLDFTYRKNKAATDLTFTIEWSDDLVTWSTVGVGAPIILSDNGVTQQIKVTVPVGANGRRFIHLKTSRP